MILGTLQFLLEEIHHTRSLMTCISCWFRCRKDRWNGLMCFVCTFLTLRLWKSDGQSSPEWPFRGLHFGTSYVALVARRLQFVFFHSTPASKAAVQMVRNKFCHAIYSVTLLTYTRNLNTLHQILLSKSSRMYNTIFNSGPPQTNASSTCVESTVTDQYIIDILTDW